MSKPKPIYSITAFGETTPSAIYSCLKTLCQQWNVVKHYSTIWRCLNNDGIPYVDGRIAIKRHELIKSKYTRK